jgi:predicted RNase H-like nuclease
MIPVIGVDGCPGGWIAVIWGTTLSHHHFPSFRDILDLDAAIIAVDMPIGLPSGFGRQAERSARKVLSNRKSSVFPIACRKAVMCADYDQARNVSRCHSDPPMSPPIQSFGIFPKIREIDSIITPELQSRIHEVHPEVSFWAMTGRVEMALSKKKPGGQFERRNALEKAGFPVNALPVLTYPKSTVAVDDIIDACACAWSARRILEGRHISFPEHPPRDEHGLEMCIKA